MIERVEVLQDGASAIYGSDAIAGVVNIITKKRQKGFDASAQLGGYDEGDGFTQNYQLSWGNGSDGPLQFVVGGNYVKQDSGQLRRSRALAVPDPGTDACRQPAPAHAQRPLGASRILPRTVTLIAPVIPGPTTPADFRPFVSPFDRFNFAPFNFLQIPLERYGVFANFRYEVADDINFSAKGIWNERKSKNQAGALAVRSWPGCRHDAGARRHRRSTPPIRSIRSALT